MNKAYIILAHHQTALLYRLLERLDDGQSFFFLHIDAKYPLQAFNEVLNRFREKIYLVDRLVIEWGGFAMVDVTLNAMRAIQHHEKKFDWIILLSGQDYPIKSNDYINRFLERSEYFGFFDYTTLPDYNRWAPAGGYYRINKYFMGLSLIPKLTAKAVNFISRWVPFLRRATLTGIIHFAGSQWWMMRGELLDIILNYVDRHPEYYAFHKYTFAADEVFFHSIILNSSEQVKSKIQNNNMRFFNWPDTRKPHPEILTEEDFERIKVSNALFARKFDADHSLAVLDLIDKRCLLHGERLPSITIQTDLQTHVNGAKR